ncbi:MAG: hypothetical protein FJX35_23605 [Alphaproteobacteria bacterium]|nr:hypothetical protein [Alphaproteobacteria bacterium]
MLRPNVDKVGANRAGATAIETYEELRNIEWQTRPAPLEPYESALADALEQILGRGTHDLPGIVAGLADMKVTDSSGRPFTEQSFQAEVKRLGA